jgi:hypothetical protein
MGYPGRRNGKNSVAWHREHGSFLLMKSRLAGKAGTPHRQIHQTDESKD